MPNLKLKTYKAELQRQFLRSFVKKGLIVASEGIEIASTCLQGRIKQVGKLPLSKAGLIVPNQGVPLILVSSHADNYRDIFKIALKTIGIDPDMLSSSDHVDHVLARSLAQPHFPMVLMSVVDAIANTTMGGGIERQSKDRKFSDKGCELASVAEIAKILEIAPMSRGNFAEDALVCLEQLIASGISRRAGVQKDAMIAAFVESVQKSGDLDPETDKLFLQETQKMSFAKGD